MFSEDEEPGIQPKTNGNITIDMSVNQTNKVSPMEIDSLLMAKDSTEIAEAHQKINVGAVFFASEREKTEELTSTLAYRVKRRKDYQIQNFELDKATDYLDHLTFQVELGDLYSVEETCHNNDNNMYCPVLLKVKDEGILKEIGANEKGEQYEYLMQVWNNKGYLYYERKMVTKPKQWSISGKLLLFCEEEPSIIYAVRLRMKKIAILFKIKMPFSEMQDVIADDIEEVPDSNLNSMLGYYEGNLFGTFQDKIFYCDLTSLIDNLEGSKEEEEEEKEKESPEPDKTYNGMLPKINLPGSRALNTGFMQRNFYEFTVKKEMISELEIDEKYKLTAIQSVNAGSSISRSQNLEGQFVLVLENQNDHQLKFMKIKFQKEGEAKVLKVIQLGACVNDLVPEENSSKIKKWISLINKDENETPFNMCVVLRENGHTCFYYNFALVEQNKELEFDDINFDFNRIYLRRTGTNNEHIVHIIDQQWQSRIGLSVSEVNWIEEGENAKAKIDQKWNLIIHKRIAGYFKLYQSFLMFETFFIIAHRSFTSIFDLSEEKWYHYNYKEAVRYLSLTTRTSSTENYAINDKGRSQTKKYTDMYKIGVVVGANQIHFMRINAHIHERFPQQQDHNLITVKGTIRRCYSDQAQFHGFYCLMSSQKPKKIMTHLGVNSFNNMFLQSDEDVNMIHLSLGFVTKGKILTLIDQSNPLDNYSKCLSDSCSFVNYTEIRPQSSETSVKQKKKKMLMILNETNKTITSINLEPIYGDSPLKRQSTLLFAFAKQKKQKAIGWKLARVPQFTIKIDNFNDETRLLNVLMVSAGKNTGYMCVVTNSKFYIFDQQHKLKFIHSGYRISSVRQADDFFIYVIIDYTNKIYIENFETKKITTYTKPQASGFYVFDFESMMKGEPESYKLLNAINGSKVEFQFSNFAQRIVFLESSSRAQICPYIHRNTINLMSVSQKSDYLIWRESDGFFSAMMRNGTIQTWSLATGNKLYNLKTKKFGDMFQNFDVYQADDNDQIYKRNFQNYRTNSLQLIISHKPIKEFSNLFTVVENNSDLFQNQMDTQRSGQKEIVKCKSQSNENTTIKMFQNQNNGKLYRFYFLKMQSHQTVEEDEEYTLEHDENVSIVFEFDFMIFENLTKDNVKQCGWEVDPTPTQKIQISADFTKLLEVVNNEFAILYEIDTTEEVLNGNGLISHNRVTWKTAQIIKRFPKLMQNDIPAMFLFSNNFTFYIDFDFQQNQIVIMETETQQPFFRIPSDMMNFNNKFGEKDVEMIPLVAKNICFYKYFEEQLIRIQNSDHVDCIFRFTRNSMEMISYEKLNNDKSQNHPHNIYMRTDLPPDATFQRYIRKIQDYKRIITQESDRRNSAIKDCLSYLYTIDYSQDWQSPKSVFISEISFSILNWLIAERLLGEKNFSLEMVGDESQRELLFCLFPKSTTLMHMIARNKNPSYSEEMSEFVQKLFDLAATPLTEKHEIFDVGSTFEIPLIQNSDGVTPIDLALGIESRSGPTNQDSEDYFCDLELAGVFLKNLKGYSYLHQGKMIVDSIVECIALKVPGIGEFMDSRLKKIQNMPHQIQNELKNEVLDFVDIQGTRIEYGGVAVAPWISDRTTKEMMYVEQGSNQQFNNYFFDLPSLHNYSEAGFRFISAMDDDDIDVSLFSFKTIQMLINFHWKQMQTKIYLLKIVPFTIMLVVFWVWSNIILQKSHKNHELDPQNFDTKASTLRLLQDLVQNITISNATNDTHSNETLGDDVLEKTRYRLADIIFCYILIVCSSYFMVTEVESIIKSPANYFKNWVENATDLIPLILLYKNTIESLINEKPLTYQFWVCQSFLSVLLWLKFISFLRSQSVMAYLIRSLFQAAKDIQIFFLILMIACIGFADAFLSLSNAMGLRYNTGFLPNYYQAFKYIWLFTLGEFNGYEDFDYFGDILFFMTTVIMIIIMLNVLIAIAGNSLSQAEENKVQYAYREKVNLICELQQNTFVKFFSSKSMQQSKNLLFLSFKEEPTDKVSQEDPITKLNKNVEGLMELIREMKEENTPKEKENEIE